MHNRLTSTVLLLCLLGAVIYSVMSLHEANKDQGLSSKNSTVGGYQNKANISRNDKTNLKIDPINHTQTQQKNSDQPSNVKTGLPIDITVLGISLNNNQALCLLEVQGQIGEFEIGDLLYGYPIQVIEISSQSVFVAFENDRFELVLTGPNLLETPSEKSHSELLSMTAEQIGNRPQIIEHFVELTPTPYIANGMLASPGFSPTLFAQAGLKEDDVIETINGKSVTIAEEFSELQRTMRHADTLVISVMRRGRRITLYLDIPAEALTLRR